MCALPDRALTHHPGFVHPAGAPTSAVLSWHVRLADETCVGHQPNGCAFLAPAAYRAAQCIQVGALDRFDVHEPPLSVLTGLEFDALPPVEQANAVAQMAVFARVEPSHKQRLVELLKAQASSRLSGRLSSAGCGPQLTVETLLQAKVLCGCS